MKCQKCGINEATTHIKQIINGHKSEVWLCHKCAGEENALSAFKQTNDYDFENFFSNLWGTSAPALKQTPNESICKTCGTTLRDIQSSGKLGCSDCYSVFERILQRPLKEIHGSCTHTGKLPKSSAKGMHLNHEIDKLKDELSRAVLDQNFEKAAELRDKIKELEQQRG